MADTETTLHAMGDEHYIQLTTFRKNGDAVGTAVWVVRDADRLLVTTGADSGKVKRLHHTLAVELRPCDRAGKVVDGAPLVMAIARDDPSEATRERLDELLLAKYGLLYRVIRAAQKLRRSSTSTAVVITAD